MPLNREVPFAVIVSAGTQGQVFGTCPATPSRSRKAPFAAAKGGAAIVQCHVRDPETSRPSRRRDLYGADTIGDLSIDGRDPKLC
ncbi:MAG: 3-keto-5-aminohexanoate cleavage protein [Pseudomonadota bacterium]